MFILATILPLSGVLYSVVFFIVHHGAWQELKVSLRYWYSVFQYRVCACTKIPPHILEAILKDSTLTEVTDIAPDGSKGSPSLKLKKTLKRLASIKRVADPDPKGPDDGDDMNSDDYEYDDEYDDAMEDYEFSDEILEEMEPEELVQEIEKWGNYEESGKDSGSPRCSPSAPSSIVNKSAKRKKSVRGGANASAEGIQNNPLHIAL